MAAQTEAVAVRVQGRSSVGAWFRKYRFQLALITPLVAYVLVFTVAPIIDTFRLSFTAPRGETFGTVQNYSAVFENAVFREAVVNTVIVALLSLALEIGVGLTVALALHTPFRGRGFARTVVLVPLGVPTIVSGAVMLLIFSRSGYLNSVTLWFAELISKIPGINWDFHPIGLTVAGGWKTLFIVAIADMWKVLPVMVLIFLAGLQSLPEDIYEAADVDGATKWQRFWKITLPLLVPYITMAIILRAIDAFRIFELALVLAGGIEPVLGTFIANRYLPPTNDPFTAASASIVLFGIIMVFIVLYLRFVAVRGEVQR
ncbi:MAG: carbohydrate ABC transporter permease [Actinomycetota bacterium]